MINIHTIEYLYPGVTQADHERIIKEFTLIKPCNKQIQVYKAFSKIQGIRYKYTLINKTGFESRLLHVIVNPMVLLGKHELLPEDFKQFTEKYKVLIQQEFNSKSLSNELLTRVDYFIDIDYEPIVKQFILKILKKAPTNYRGLRKYTYKSSIYYSSRSRNINIYSRYERLVKIKLQDCFYNSSQVDMSAEIIPNIAEKYKNTIRYEVQLKRKKIWCHQNSDGIIANLFNYWSERTAAYFLNDILKPIIFNGNYYNSYHARKKLMEHYSKKLVDRLIKFQNCISSHGIEYAKVKYKNYYGYIQKLVDVGVNPFLIPYNDRIKQIENQFTFYKNSSDIYKIPDSEWMGLIKRHPL